MRKKIALVLTALTALIVVCDIHVSTHKPNLIDHKTRKWSMVTHATFPETKTKTNTNNEDYPIHTREKRSPPSESEKADTTPDHKRRRHHRANSTEKQQERLGKRKGRCRRYVQTYYQPYQKVPVYVPKYDNRQNYLAPNYVPPQYVVPTYYSARCRSYCVPCVTSACRRRCPNYPGVTTTATTNPSATITVITKPPCNCSRDGSIHPACDDTGVCLCKPNYDGKTCGTCKDGYWKNPNKDCVLCNCNRYGSRSSTYCDKATGRCYCKDGVTGAHCDACRPYHYGTIEQGCKACDPCDKKGHICDPQNGKCICPPLTTGEECQHCIEDAWGFEPGRGCKECQCSKTGRSKCDVTRGICTCKTGYEGEKCDRCSSGYYGYPDCKKCNCHTSGTTKDDCRGNNCRCNDDGRCRCKENVEGVKCDACKPRSFGLAKENPQGCTQCFCFGRSNECNEAHLNWFKIRTDKKISATEVVDSDHWKLPDRFMRDLTTSYGGNLTVDMMEGYFTVNIEGNGIKLQASSSSHNGNIQLVETNWNIVSRSSKYPTNCQSQLTRPCFMVVLQNVTSLIVEANNRIRQVLLDKAEPNLPTYPPSSSIEKCECPKEYTGLSCQDPNVGYFRYYSNDPKDDWIDVVVGKAKPCECNNKAHICDPNTGFCKNCTLNTTGRRCESCVTGYYKDNHGNCSPCLCPSASKNNAESCSPIENSFKCNCKKGYKGQFCDKCDDGHFDTAPSTNSVTCEPCNCNPFGVINGEKGICNYLGVCQCREGFKGVKCDECVSEMEFIKDGICTPCDECTKLLFSEIDNLTSAVEDTFNLFKDGISPPWNTLTHTIDRHHMLSEKLKNKKQQTEKLLENAKLDQYEKKINNMQNKLKKENEIAKKNIDFTNELESVSSAVAEQIEDLKTKLINIIQDLDNSESKPVDLENALKKAKGILKRINDISKKFDKQKDQESLQFCANVSEKINDIYKPPLNIPDQLLKDLKNKLNDLTNITATIESMAKKAENKNLENAERIEKLKEKIEKIKKEDKDAENSVRDLMSKINATDDLLHKLEVVYDDLKSITDFIEYKQLEHRIRRQMNDNPKINEIVLKAIDHVKELENTINSYRSIFNFTKDEWKKINASGAYEELLNGIKEAQKDAELSKKILENATKLINPSDSDNLIDKANVALTYSKGLEQRVKSLKDISKSLGEIKHKLDQFKYSILNNGKANNDLNQILNNMGTEITSQAERVSKLEEAIANSTATSEDMQNIEKQIEDVLSSSHDNVFKKYNIFLNLTSKEEIEKLKAKINNTRKHLESLNINSTYFDTIKNFNRDNRDKNLQSIQDKIDSLRNKINYAKQAADAISIAMNITDCRMSYQLPQMEIFQSLSITFKCETCQLFKLSNADGKLNLAVSKNDISLTFNDKNVLISNTGENKEKTINIEKLGSLIKMQVDTIEKTEMVGSPYYFIYPNDKIEIGSLNNKAKTKSYISNVILNGKKFGLWKFSQTQGNCTGETRDETDKQTENTNMFFNGKGYTVYGKNNKLNPAKVTLGFDFNTFDENSLIYLASFEENNLRTNEDNCAHIALFLKNGYLNLVVRHSNSENSSLTLDNKYNNGRKYHAQINMQYDKAGVQHYILFAKNDTLEDSKDTTKILNARNVFKIKQVFHYVGGVPPIFNTTCLHVNFTSFLGFLQLTSPLTNENISYGITKTDKQILEFYQVRVYKKGYMKVRLAEETIESISFILRPTSPNGIVMRLGQHKIYLNNSQLGIGDGLEDDPNIVLDKNDYNTVNASLKDGILTVNRNQQKLRLPPRINIGDSVVTIGDASDGFGGGLSNILVNNKELLFTPSSVIEFSKVEIGRESPPTKPRIHVKAAKTLSPYMTNTLRNFESCARSPNYDIIPDAIKFGDKSNSYTHIKSSFWKDDCKIDFQLRTFSPDGVIFTSIGNQKQPHYNLLKLTDGQLGFYAKGRKNKSPVIINGKLNDGQWHTVELSKNKRRLTVVLDGNQKKTFKFPKTAVRNEIYFGGVPLNSDYLNVLDLKDYLGPFRGCMRSLIINGEHQFVDNKNVNHSNTRQCWTNIEEGAYFDGNTFAKSTEHFKINKILELSFEFKTSQQTGVLLSVSRNGKSPALSVELQNGAVVVTLDNGNGILSNFTYDLISNVALCNNKWHNVTAMYSNSEMTVNVNGIRKIWVQSDRVTLLDEIDAPLHVGGIPSTLKSRQNFKGCIRKLKIQSVLIDWNKMRQPSNVLLNSCPV